MKPNVSENKSTKKFKLSMLRLLEKKSISKIVLDDLLKESNLSKSTFYSYFYGVDDLFYDIINDLIYGLLNENIFFKKDLYFFNDKYNLFKSELKRIIEFSDINSNILKNIFDNEELKVKFNYNIKNILSKRNIYLLNGTLNTKLSNSIFSELYCSVISLRLYDKKSYDEILIDVSNFFNLFF